MLTKLMTMDGHEWDVCIDKLMRSYEKNLFENIQSFNKNLEMDKSCK